MPTQHIIRFMSGRFQLTGTLHLPDRPQPDTVIGCHGLLADRRSPKQIVLAESLNRAGIAYFRFDHRGCGDSQGTLEANSLLDSRCRDLYHAMACMQSHSNVGSVIGLFGSSFGGTVVMATAAERSVAAIVTYAAPIASHAVGTAAGKQIRAHHALSGDDLSTLSFDIGGRLGALRNILIVHGARDEIVPPDHARRIYAAAREPKKLICIDDCDHRMSNAAHQGPFIDACTAWFRGFQRFEYAAIHTG